MKDDDFRALTPLEKRMFGQAIKHSGKLIAIGVLLVICGIIGLIAETAFSYASITILGVVAFVGGILIAAHAFQSKGWRTFLIQSVFAAIYIGVGIFIWMAPLVALEGLTLWLAGLFLITGVLRIIAVTQNSAGNNLFWPVLSGVLSIVLGGLILYSWPASSLWLPGLLLAIELVLHGLACLFIGLVTREVAKQQ